MRGRIQTALLVVILTGCGGSAAEHNASNVEPGLGDGAAGAENGGAEAGSSGAGAGQGSKDGSSGDDAGAILDASVIAVADHPGSCMALPEAGTWQNITPPQINLNPKFMPMNDTNYGTQNFVIDPTNSSTLYLGSSKQGMYKTTDCGATWSHVNTGKNGALLDQGRNWAMVIDPTNPQTIYTCAGYGPGGVFKSTNAGVDWTQILPSNITSITEDGFIQAITMDPTNTQHLLVSFHTPCTGDAGGAGCMAETKNGGTSWNIVAGPAAWSEGDSQNMINGSYWYFGSGAIPGGLWRTTNAGSTWTQVWVNNGNTGYASSELLQTSQGTLLVPGPNGILESTNNGVTWSLIPKSPMSLPIVETTSSLVVSFGDNVTAPAQWYYKASPTDPSKWTQIPGVALVEGGRWLHYDPYYHVLYSTNFIAGFWRVVMQ